MKNYINKIIRKSVILFPQIFYPLYLQRNRFLMRGANLKRGILSFSFDNDYSSDNEATELLLNVLKPYGIKVTWAVVGLWVAKYHSLHERLIREGHELMNHSWSHPDNSELRPNDPRKFNQLSADEIDEEISKIHEFCLNELDYRMTGFRMPHFRRHPAISSVLRRLDYKYTSNHNALYSPTLGIPYVTNEGWVELPLSGTPRKPERIFETYRLFRNPDGFYSGEEQFYNDFSELIKLVEKYKLVGVIYLDPCDVLKFSKPDFSKYLKEASEREIDILTLGELASKVSKWGDS